MKKRILALLSAAVLLLTGCSAVLDREFFSVHPHNAALMDETDPAAFRADSYQEIVNALMYLVSQGSESGRLRIYLDPEQIDGFLKAACHEVVEEDPLGAYAVEFIRHQVTTEPDCSEAKVVISYRRTQEQIRSIVSATGSTAIRGELKAALASFQPECTLRLGYFDQDEAYLQLLTRQAYYDDPLSALDFPEVSVQMCPDHGRQRIVELRMEYHLSPSQLAERRNEVNEALILLQRAIPFISNRQDLRPISSIIRRRIIYDPVLGGNTPWHALTQGRADSEGLALTFAALCQKVDIPCRVADGTLDGQEHFWNVVGTPEGWRHLDLTEAVEHPLLRVDTQMPEEGYAWLQDSLPRCAHASRP